MQKTRQSIMIYSDLLGTSTLFLRILEGVFPCFSSVRSFEIKPTSLVIFFQRFIPYWNFMICHVLGMDEHLWFIPYLGGLFTLTATILGWKEGGFHGYPDRHLATAICQEKPPLQLLRLRPFLGYRSACASLYRTVRDHILPQQAETWWCWVGEGSWLIGWLLN